MDADAKLAEARAAHQLEVRELRERLHAAREAERQCTTALYGMLADKIVSACRGALQARLVACVERWRINARFMPRPPRALHSRATSPASSASARPDWARPGAARARALAAAGPGAEEALLAALREAASTQRPAWAKGGSALRGLDARHVQARFTALLHADQLGALFEGAQLLALARAFGQWAWAQDADEAPAYAADEQARRRVLLDVRVGPVSAIEHSLVDIRLECGALAVSHRLGPGWLLARFAEPADALADELRLSLHWRAGAHWRGAGSLIGALTIPMHGLVDGAGALAGVWVLPQAPRHRVEVSVERTAERG